MTFSFVRPFMFIGLISFNNLFPVHPRIFQSPSTNVNFLSSNNCKRKLSCTFGEATIIIFLVIPICFKYSRCSSQTPIDVHVFPEPNP